MRTENPSPVALTVARLRAQGARARRSIMARGAATRWALAVAALAVLGMLGYLAATPPVGKYLGGGRAYSSDDLIRITRALDAKQVDYRVDDQNRIGVASDDIDDAAQVVAALNVGGPSLAELKEKSQEYSFLTSPQEEQQRQLRAREAILEVMIRRLAGIASATVTINRTRTAGLRPRTHETAFVYVETAGGREIEPTTVQAIQNLIVGSEPELKHDAVTVCDQKGRRYLDALNPSINALNRTRAREGELAQEILDQLDWVKGVRVTVQLIPAPAPGPIPAPAPAVPPGEAAPVGSAVGVNEPLALDPEPEPGPAPSPPLATASGPPKPPDDQSWIARVWVKVPRSFYYLKALPHRAPSLDDLQPIVARTESLIRTAVGHVVPPGESSEVLIDTIPDDVPPAAALIAPNPPAAHRTVAWWVPAVAVGGVALLALAARLVAARRPEVRPPAVGRGRFPGGDPEPVTGASERVRELIRLNPEAAASVLNRWIGQGGNRE